MSVDTKRIWSLKNTDYISLSEVKGREPMLLFSTLHSVIISVYNYVRYIHMRNVIDLLSLLMFGDASC